MNNAIQETYTASYRHTHGFGEASARVRSSWRNWYYFYYYFIGPTSGQVTTR